MDILPILPPNGCFDNIITGGNTVEQTTVPNEEFLTKNAENEVDAIDNQQDLQPNLTCDAETVQKIQIKIK